MVKLAPYLQELPLVVRIQLYLRGPEHVVRTAIEKGAYSFDHGVEELVYPGPLPSTLVPADELEGIRADGKDSRGRGIVAAVNDQFAKLFRDSHGYPLNFNRDEIRGIMSENGIIGEGAYGDVHFAALLGARFSYPDGSAYYFSCNPKRDGKKPWALLSKFPRGEKGSIRRAINTGIYRPNERAKTFLYPGGLPDTVVPADELERIRADGKDSRGWDLIESAVEHFVALFTSKGGQGLQLSTRDVRKIMHENEVIGNGPWADAHFWTLMHSSFSPEAGARYYWIYEGKRNPKPWFLMLDAGFD